MAEMQPKYIEGTWPEHCEQRAFVAGAKWWEFASTGGTMWASDRDKAEAEAVRRYGEPAASPASSDVLTGVDLDDAEHTAQVIVERGTGHFERNVVDLATAYLRLRDESSPASETATIAQDGEIEQQSDAGGAFCSMCAGGYRGETPPEFIDCEFCQDTGYEDGRR